MERVVLNLGRSFSERAYRVRVVLPESGSAAQTQQWFAGHGVEAEVTSALKHSFGRRRFNETSALQSLLRQSAAPVVNLHYGMNFPSLNEVLAVRLAGKRCVVSVHAGGGSDPPAPGLRVAKNRVAGTLCSAVVGVSRFQARELVRNGVPRHRVRVVPGGVLRPTMELAKMVARRQLALPEEAFLVVSAGRVTDRKGFDTLIHALHWLPTAAPGQPEIFLAIAGDGPERERLEALAEQLLPGRHRFLGLMPDTNLLYAAGDLFALASLEESFGLVYAEAALMGLPSVGTAVGGVPETVLNEKTGLLVPPEDINRLAEAVQTLWRDPALLRKMGTRAQQRAEREFTAERMADRYEAILFPPASSAGLWDWNELSTANGMDL